MQHRLTSNLESSFLNLLSTGNTGKLAWLGNHKFTWDLKSRYSIAVLTPYKLAILTINKIMLNTAIYLTVWMMIACSSIQVYREQRQKLCHHMASKRLGSVIQLLPVSVVSHKDHFSYTCPRGRKWLLQSLSDNIQVPCSSLPTWRNALTLKAARKRVAVFIHLVTNQFCLWKEAFLSIETPSTDLSGKVNK